LRSSKSNAGGSRKCTPVFHVPGVVSPVSGVVSLVAGEVSPVDGLVSSIAGVVSPVDRVMSPFRGVVSPVPSTSAAGVSSPSSVYSTAPEELRVTSPGDISLKSQSSYHTGKSSIPRSHMMSSQGLGRDPSSQCISPVSEDASQSSFHTIVSSQHTEADITEDNITEYEDDILHNKDGDISMDEIEIIFESFTVPERIPTSRTSSDTSLKEGFLNSLIQKGITMISPSKKTDLNKSLSGANENLSLAVEDKLRESSVYESREHETAAGIQDPNINQDTADDASKEEDSVVNEELTENAKQSTSAEEREAASIRKRRRSSHYNWPTRFKQGDSLEQARRTLKIVANCVENGELIERLSCKQLLTPPSLGPFILFCRIKEVSFPYGDEAHQCLKCSGIYPLGNLRGRKKSMRCKDCRGKPEDIKKTMFIKLKVKDQTGELDLNVFGEHAVTFCGTEIRNKEDSYFTSLQGSQVELRILVSDIYIVHQSQPNFDAWKADKQYDKVFDTQQSAITDDEN